MQIFFHSTRNFERKKEKPNLYQQRLSIIISIIFIFGGLIIFRLFYLQIINHSFYAALASDQHEVFTKLFPKRGEIFVQDYMAKDSIYTGELNGGYIPKFPIYPYALNKDFKSVYAVPKEIKDPKDVSEKLTEFFFEPREKEKDESDETYQANMVIAKDDFKIKLEERLSKPDDPYEPIKQKVDDDTIEKIRQLNFPGIYFADETFRFYPEGNIGSNIIGFLSNEGNIKKGSYGIEGYWNKELTGQSGEMEVERDAFGRWITLTEKKMTQAQDGTDIIMTIDRNIEYFACSVLNREALRHGADSGSVVILDPPTGKILAICSYPDFDPNNYGKTKDLNSFNDQAVYGQYEPGSIFKPLTMAAALDTGVVEPQTTYNDPGEEKISGFTIKNFDDKSHGVCTMTQVLEQSLNTGVIFAMRKTGMDVFQKYIKNFGIGTMTNIQIEKEMPGSINSLNNKNEIYYATASFGQGIMTTPLQMVAAFNAIANKGKLMQPYIIEETVNSEGEVKKYEPKEIRQVISEHTANILSGMMVSVIENGHAKKAKIDGYYMAGKTGTAQLAEPGTGRYSGKTIHSFGGFAPVDNPRFTMLVRIDNPKDVQYAEGSALPAFREIAQFLLNYFQVPTEK